MSRVYELAKKFNKDSKRALDILKKRGFKVANNFSSVGDAEYNALKEFLSKARRKNKRGRAEKYGSQKGGRNGKYGNA